MLTQQKGYILKNHVYWYTMRHSTGFTLLECTIYMATASVLATLFFGTISTTTLDITHAQKSLIHTYTQASMYDIMRRDCLSMVAAQCDPDGSWIFKQSYITKKKTAAERWVRWVHDQRGIIRQCSTMNTRGVLTRKQTQIFRLSYQKWYIQPCFDAQQQLYAVACSTISANNTHSTFIMPIGRYQCKTQKAV